MMPSCDQIGVPIHFHSSTTSESASLMSVRILLRVSPRQSPSSAILFEMSSDADRARPARDFFMFSSYNRSSLHATSRASRLQGFGALGDQPEGSTPNGFAYSAFNRCQPPNFMASGPTMRPMGWPARSRSSTSKQMCHPAAPIEMKRRSMLVHSVRRVPPLTASSSHRILKPPQL